jgi:hypothetical protein
MHCRTAGTSKEIIYVFCSGAASGVHLVHRWEKQHSFSYAELLTSVPPGVSIKQMKGRFSREPIYKVENKGTDSTDLYFMLGL